jgi:hypothetical protein
MKKFASLDGASGLMFIVLGALGIALSSQEKIGTAARMDSGFMPMLLSCGLALMGAMVIAGAQPDAPGERQGLGLRGLLVVLVAIAAFAATVRSLGLGPAVFLTTVIASYAEKGRRPVPVVVSAIVFSLFCVATFIWGLGLPIPSLVLPWIS